MKKIKCIFEKFVIAMEKNDYSASGDYISKNVQGRFSNIGVFDNIDDFIHKMSWKGQAYDDYIIRITNFAMRGNQEEVQQSAYIQAIICREEGDFLHYFLYGGHFSIHYFWDEEWMMDEIRFDMDYVGGNTAFVEGWWKLIDYQYFMGQKLTSSVLGELDSPWIKFPESEYEMTDVEAIKDVFFQYAFSMDTADFTNLMKTYDENICAVMPHGTFSGKRDFTAYFKYVRLKEATFSHAVYVKNITVLGDHAQAVLYRTEPHRIGTKVIHKLNKENVFFSAVYRNEFVKKNGRWYMTSINYEAGIFNVEIPKTIHYIDDFDI